MKLLPAMVGFFLYFIPQLDLYGIRSQFLRLVLAVIGFFFILFLKSAFLYFLPQLGLCGARSQFLRLAPAVLGLFLYFTPQFGLCGARSQFSRLTPVVVAQIFTIEKF